MLQKRSADRRAGRRSGTRRARTWPKCFNNTVREGGDARVGAEPTRGGDGGAEEMMAEFLEFICDALLLHAHGEFDAGAAVRVALLEGACMS